MKIEQSRLPKYFRAKQPETKSLRPTGSHGLWKYAALLILVGTVLFAGTLSPVLLWQDQADLGFFEEALAIAAHGERVFAAGSFINEVTFSSDFIVRAYHKRSGELLWEDIADLGSFDEALAIAAHGKHVFVAGNSSTEVFDQAGNLTDFTIDFLVRAYNARDGHLLWQDRVFDGEAGAIAMKGKRVFAVGNVFNDATGSVDFLVRAYNSKNGTLLWQDQFDVSGSFDTASAIAVQGNRVFVSGSGVSATARDFLVRTYDAKRGHLLWDDQFDLNGGFDQALAIAAQGKSVFVAGYGSVDPPAPGSPPDPDPDFDFLVRAYHAKRGHLLWEDQFDLAGSFDQARAIAVQGERVFVTGVATDPETAQDIVVRAYRTNKGRLLWHNQFDVAEDFDIAEGIAVQGSRVFVAGSGNKGTFVDEFGFERFDDDFLLLAYHQRKGTLLWQDQFDQGGREDLAFAVAVRSGRVFAAGLTVASDDFDSLLVRAYRAEDDDDDDDNDDDD